MSGVILKNKGTKYGIILLLLILALTGANLLFGSVNLSLIHISEPTRH